MNCKDRFKFKIQISFSKIRSIFYIWALKQVILYKKIRYSPSKFYFMLCKRFIIVLLSISFGFPLWAQVHHRVAVLLNGKTSHDLALLGIEAEHGEYIPGKVFVSDLSQQEIDLLVQQGFQLKTIIEDVSHHYAAQNQAVGIEERNAKCGNSNSNYFPYPVPANYTSGTMGGYPTYSEMLAILDDMHQKYPGLITQRAVITDTLLTHEGRPIWWVKISDNPNENEEEAELLYTSLHHCREPLGLTQNLFFMWHLLENYETDPEVQYILNNSELYFVPCVNPDGYLYNESTNPTGGGMWRKNLRDNLDGNFGVDLNRNYGYQWGVDNSGSSPNTFSGTYRGPAPFSEPETQMMRDFCLNHDFQRTLNYHTFGNLLVYPWAYSDDVADPQLPFLSEVYNKFSRFKAGTVTETVGYPVNGSSDDWMYAEGGSYSYTPETGPSTYAFWPPALLIDSLNKVTQWTNHALALSALKFADPTDLSPAEITSTSFLMPVRVTNYGVEGGDFTVFLDDLSDVVTAIEPMTTTLSLQPGESTIITFTLTVPDNLDFEQEIPIDMVVDNGHFDLRQRVVKTSFVAPVVPLQTNTFEDENSVQGLWGLTQEDFISSPNSWTDSPFADYLPNSSAYGETVESVFIPENAAYPRLEFMAKWQIEGQYDWVMIEAVLSDGSSLPLCGRYSHSGGPAQPSDIPLWDGYQNDWVKEQINLSDYKGENIRFRFTLFADGALEFPGFFVDDMLVYDVDTTTSLTLNVPNEIYKWSVAPNPATNWIDLRTSLRSDQGVVLHIEDVLGRELITRKVLTGSRWSERVAIGDLKPGLYYFRLEDARNGKTEVKAVMVE